MLRINAIPNTAAGKAYYAAGNDYYLEGKEQPAFWHGKGADLLGLSGEVRQEDFERLCDNLKPDGSQLTAKTLANRRVGYDLTWSVSKSVSLAYALGGDERIADAFRAAVAETMTEIEKEMATRVRKKGGDFDRSTGNIIWTDFLHTTSRPINGQPDPQLHIHAVVFNATFDREEGQWKAGQFGGIKADAPYFQAAFRSRLANQLQLLGYGVTRKRDDFEITSIPARAVKEFSRRTDQIEKLAGALGVTKPETKAKLGATSRQAKTKGLTWDDLQGLWNDRLSPAEREAIRDAVAGADLPMAAPDRSRESVDYALRHLLERKSVVPERQVVTEALKFGLGDVTPESVYREVSRLPLIRRELEGRVMVSTRGVLDEEKALIVWAREGRGRYRPLNRAPGKPSDRPPSGLTAVAAEADRANTARTVAFGQPETKRGTVSDPPSAGRAMRDASLAGAGPSTPPAHGRTGDGRGPDATPALLFASNRPEWREDQSRREPARGTGLLSPPPQPRSDRATSSPLAQAERSGSSATTIELSPFQQAGTGSTSKPTEPVLNLSPSQQAAIRHVLTSPDRVMLVRGFAGTGKTTMTRSLFSQVQVPWVILAPSAEASRGVLRRDGFQKADTLAAFLLSNEMQQSVKGGLIVLDEASLAGAADLSKLSQAANSLNARVLLLGDRRQHKSVARGDVIALLEDKAGVPVATVSDVQRQRGRYKQAVELLARGKVAEGFDLLDAMGWVKQPDQFVDLNKMVAADYLDALQKDRSVLVVSPTHAEGEKVTAAIRERLKQEGVLHGEEREFERLEPLHWTEAERADPTNYRDGLVAQFVRNGTGHRAGARVGLGGRDTSALSRQANRFGVFGRGSIRLQAGDSLRITANGRDISGKHRLNNGATYRIDSFTKDGDIRLDNGWVVGKEFGHLSHGYAVTSHAAQGKTVDVVLIAQSTDSFPASNASQFYVSASRGRESTRVYTDNAEALREAIQRTDHRLLASDLVRTPRHGLRKRLKRHIGFLHRVAEATKELIRGKEPALYERQ